MDPALAKLLHDLIHEMRELVQRVDGVICHVTSVDADYSRVKTTLAEHDQRLARLERHHDYEPPPIEPGSALFPAIRAETPP